MTTNDIYIDGVRNQENIMAAMKIIESARSGRGEMARNDRTLHISIPIRHLDEEVETHLQWAQQQAAKGHINVRVHYRDR